MDDLHIFEPRRAKLSKFKSAFLLTFGAENETRTRDPNLGKVMLYQLSYFRKFLRNFRVFGLRLGNVSELSLLSTCTKTPRSFRLGLQRYEHFLYFQTFLQKFSKNR